MVPDPQLEAFCAFYNNLDKTCTKQLYRVYTDGVSFTDPLHRIQGITALKAYFDSLYENVTSCRFDYHDTRRQGDTAFVTWTMHLTHPSLAGGQPVRVAGCSRLVFAANGSGLVAEHRDYFDVGELLYERLPLLGAVVRRIKRRLAG